MALAVCVGFAPAFRLVALRHLAKLPDDMRFALAPQIARLQRVQKVELGLVAAVVLYAFVATFGLAPPDAVQVYRALLICWWMVAAGGVRTQLKLGDALARKLVDPSVLPTDEPAQALRRIALSMALVLAAFAMYTSSFVLGATDAGQLLAGGSIAVLLAGCGVYAYGAFAALAHAGLVCECVLECEALRDAPQADLLDDQDGFTRDERTPASNLRPPPPPDADRISVRSPDDEPHDGTHAQAPRPSPKRPPQLEQNRRPWDDDDPIPLA